MAEAKVLAQATLSESCIELHGWRETGLLTGDYVRNIARVLDGLGSGNSLTLAASIVTAEAVKRVALLRVDPDQFNSHRCIRCSHNYTPPAGHSEDCPVCGCDGTTG